MAKRSEFMHHPWIEGVRARLFGATTTAHAQNDLADSTLPAAQPVDAAAEFAAQAPIVAHDAPVAAAESASDVEADAWTPSLPQRPRRLARSAQVGVLSLVIAVIWWTWPRAGAPDYTLAAQWNSRSAAPDIAALAVVNPANAARATAVAGNGIMASLAPTPTPLFTGIVVVTPTAAGVISDTRDEEEIPFILLESSTLITDGAPILIELELPAGEMVVAAAAQLDPEPAPELALVLPTATPSPSAEAQEIALAPVPHVEVVPIAGLTPTATPVTPTPTPTAIPSPTPPSVGPGRLWSTFTPRPAAENDHFWVGNPFAGFASNRFASPNYQFGSTAGNRYRPHHGVDISNPLGTPVQSGVEGVVVHAGPDDPDVLGPYPNFYGKAVVILLDRRLPVAGGELDVFVLHGHLSEVRVEVGQRVAAGDIVGLVGMTGIAIGPHLHVEVRLGANTYNHSVNPYLWLEPSAGHGAVAVRVLTADGRTWAGARVSIARFEGGQAVWARQIETYLDTENIGPDPAWGENGAMGDVPAGTYYLIANIDNQSIRAEFVVRPGETSFVEIRTGR